MLLFPAIVVWKPFKVIRLVITGSPVAPSMGSCCWQSSGGRCTTGARLIVAPPPLFAALIAAMSAGALQGTVRPVEA